MERESDRCIRMTTIRNATIPKRKTENIMTPKKEQHRRGGTRSEIRDLPNCLNCGNEIGPAEAYELRKDEHGQVQVWHATRLYFDECAAAIPKVLQEMGFCIAPKLPEGTPDVDWLTQAGKEGWTVITQDSKIFRNKDEREALINNKVKCFIIPARSKNTWDQVRGFVSMWDKIRVESRYLGPFVWRFNDESQPVRWEQLLPKALSFAPYDLSRVPVGHLLNLFADIVHQHDEGWFSADFVNGLHDNIRREIEARITGDRSIAMKPDDKMEMFFNRHISGDAGETLDIDLEKPINPAEGGILVIEMNPDDGPGQYLWLIPAHKVGYNTMGSNAAAGFGESSFAFQAGPTGFLRSGFGLQLKQRRKKMTLP